MGRTARIVLAYLGTVGLIALTFSALPGEVGRVIAVNRNHPLRPRVEIVADGKGQRLTSPKTTDLAEAPFLYITGAVAEGGH